MAHEDNKKNLGENLTKKVAVLKLQGNEASSKLHTHMLNLLTTS
jgi:hypothetical protein